MLCHAGQDDIFWVNQLQAALSLQGYHCGEEESEDFVYGPNTESALITFQARHAPTRRTVTVPRSGTCRTQNDAMLVTHFQLSELVGFHCPFVRL